MHNPYATPKTDAREDFPEASLPGDLPAAAIEQVRRLQGEGYRIHRVWTNGIEMRQGAEFRWWLFVMHVAVLTLAFPLFVSASDAGQVRVA